MPKNIKRTFNRGTLQFQQLWRPRVKFNNVAIDIINDNEGGGTAIMGLPSADLFVVGAKLNVTLDATGQTFITSTFDSSVALGWQAQVDSTWNLGDNGFLTNQAMDSAVSLVTGPKKLLGQAASYGTNPSLSPPGTVYLNVVVATADLTAGQNTTLLASGEVELLLALGLGT